MDANYKKCVMQKMMYVRELCGETESEIFRYAESTYGSWMWFVKYICIHIRRV